jgi:hypothetical protein
MGNDTRSLTEAIFNSGEHRIFAIMITVEKPFNSLSLHDRHPEKPVSGKSKEN